MTPISVELGHNPALAAARVVESAVDLARAETKLVSLHARTLLVRTVAVLLAAMLATSSAQVALVLLALSPVFLAGRPPVALLIVLLPSLCLTALGLYLTLTSWRDLRRRAHSSQPGAN